MTILKEFLFGGTMVASISILANFVDPILAGLLAGIPIGLPTIYFISKDKATSYITNLSITTFMLLAVTLLYFYLYTKKKWSKNITILYTMFIWLISVIIIYVLQKYFI
jgi:hypothetical protein